MAVEARRLHLLRRASAIPMDNHHHRHTGFSGSTLPFLDEEISTAIRHQQIELERYVSYQTEKARRELWDRRRLHFLRVITAVERWVAARIRSKEEEIEKMERINRALEDRVRSLSAENQLWRELAQANEATANSLRAELEQVLAHGDGPGEEDAESRCNDFGGDPAAIPRRMCRVCRAAEPSVLLLPCRHLCLCAACGPLVVSCPVCTCDKNGSVNVNVS